MSYKKYDIKQLEQVFLGIFLLKSRFGTSDIMIPMGFYGDSSQYRELPKVDHIFDYEALKTPDWTKKEYKNKDNSNQKSKFIL